jgi:hypothetical protein
MTNMLWLGVIIVAAAWVGLLIAGVKSDMLRNSNFTGVGRRPFSLARVQMCWWFGLVFGAYVFLWAMTLELPTLNSTTLILLGISSGASLTATGIDLPPERGVPPSVGFFHDILTDAQGVTLARLQMLMWNVVLGIFYMVDLFNNAQMPCFDTTTLGLLGISTGAYLGFKVPEKQINAAVKEAQGAAPSPNSDPRAGYSSDQPPAPTDPDPKAGYAIQQ